jgi:hypothetical protein
VVRDPLRTLENSSPVFSPSACATLPDRCAWRPESSAKASKIRSDPPTLEHVDVIAERPPV